VRWGVVAEADGEPNQGAEFVGEKRRAGRAELLHQQRRIMGE
jgi:hypothetical protein